MVQDLSKEIYINGIIYYIFFINQQFFKLSYHNQIHINQKSYHILLGSFIFLLIKSYKFISNNKVDANRLNYYKRLIWKRTTELDFDANIKNEFIEPNDVIQGQIGNCYFLSALSSLAQYPQRVINLFVNLDYAKVGMYIIRFCVNGEFQNIVVDDYIPFDPVSKQPAFTKSQGNKIWPIILEKAWAKILGGYENSSSGHSLMAFSFLTGAPCLYLDHSLEKDLKKKILTSDKALHIITASNAKQHLEQHVFEQNGLVNDHVYSLISLQTVYLQGREENLINLRNPWGKQEWKGPWSKFDKQRWTPELQKKLGYYFLKDGEFFMSFFDYESQFRGTTICMYNESFLRSSIKINQSQSSITMLEFDLQYQNREGTFHIMVYQMYEKLGKNLSRNYEYSNVKILLGKLETDQKLKYKFPIEYIGGSFGKDYQTGLNFFDPLSPGKYYILIEVDWKQQILNEIVAAVYSIQNIKLKKTNYIEGSLQNILKSCAYKKSARKSYTYQGLEKSFLCFSLSDCEADYGYYYIHNDSDVTFKEIVTFSQLHGYRLLPPHGGQNAVCSVSLGENEIIVLKRLEGHGQVQTSSILYQSQRLYYMYNNLYNQHLKLNTTTPNQWLLLQKKESKLKFLIKAKTMKYSFILAHTLKVMSCSLKIQHRMLLQELSLNLKQSIYKYVMKIKGVCQLIWRLYWNLDRQSSSNQILIEYTFVQTQKFFNYLLILAIQLIRDLNINANIPIHFGVQKRQQIKMKSLGI